MISQSPDRVYRRRRRFWPFGSIPTYDAPIYPQGYLRVTLVAGQSVMLNTLALPPSSDGFVLNVEGAPIRYTDSGDGASDQFGELYPAGSFFYRAVDPHVVMLSADRANSATAYVNLSFYSAGIT